MQTLTHAQRQALKEQPEVPLQLLDPDTKTTYVLLRLEDFARLFEDREDDFDVRSLYPMMAKVFGPAGWDDPEMDAYDELDPRRKS